jgi:predicted lipoprotein with Yx(FWY)xxD motif
MKNHTSLTRPLAGAAGIVAVGLLLAACGSSSSSGAGYGTAGGSSPSPAATHAASSSGMTVQTGKTEYGNVLVDSKGDTLYAFAADSQGKSNCTGVCLQYWPAASVSGAVTHAAGVTAKLATLTRSDGTTQLTVNGWPAYTYAADSGPGQANGQGKNLSGGLWWVLSPAGQQIMGTDNEDSGSSTSSSGGYGYGR